MKIKSPLASKKEVSPLCDAGADEFFCGIETYNWRRRYRGFCINQRSSRANFVKFKDLEKAISIAHKYKAKVHVAVNAFLYSEGQYKMAASLVKEALGIGADGVIIADPVLLLMLGRSVFKGKDVVIGCDATVFNSCAVELYKSLGATRMVLDRSMTINEMKQMVAVDSTIEYESFIINDLCFFVDGFCACCKEQFRPVWLQKKTKINDKISIFTARSSLRQNKRSFCRGQFSQQKVSLTYDAPIGSVKTFSFWDKKHIEGCGACAIYDFKKIGIKSLKILDRNLPTEKKIRSTLFIRKCQDLLKEDCLPKKDYIRQCKHLFSDTFKVSCNRYDCYYPSFF